MQAPADGRQSHGDQLYISTVTVAEIDACIARSIRIGATAKVDQLRQ